MKGTISFVIAAVVIVGGLWFWKDNKSPDSVDEPVTEQPTINTDSGNGTGAAVSVDSEVSVGTAKTFTVIGKSFSFSPSEMRVRKGDTVKIIFNNTEGTHDFVMDEFNVRTARIAGGTSAEATFVADKTGSFEYYCSVGQHRQMGMKGTLVVE